MQGRGASLRSLLVEVALGEVEPLPAQELHAEGVEEALRVLAEGRPEHLYRRHEGERAPGRGVDLAHQEGGVLALEAVEPVPAPLRYELPYLDVVLLAGALLVGAHGVAVEQARLPGPLPEQGGYPVLVGELGPVVGQDRPEDPPRGFLAAQRVHDEPQGGLGLAAGLGCERQGQLEARGAVQDGQKAGGVELGPLDGVHLPAGRALVLRELPELVVGPPGVVPGGLFRRAAPALLVAHLPPELHVGHLAVSPVAPPVDRGCRHAEVGMERRDLLGGEAPPHPRADDPELPLELGLVLVHAPPGLDEHAVGVLLGEPRRVLDAGLPRAAVPRRAPAPVAAPRPRGEDLACRLQAVGRLGALQGLGGDHVAVPLHLVGDRGRRPPYGLRDLAAGGALLEHLLYLVPVMPREAGVRPSGIALLPVGHSDLPLFPGPLSGPQEKEVLILIATRIAEFSNRFAQLTNLGRLAEGRGTGIGVVEHEDRE